MSWVFEGNVISVFVLLSFLGHALRVKQSRLLWCIPIHFRSHLWCNHSKVTFLAESLDESVYFSV